MDAMRHNETCVSLTQRISVLAFNDVNYIAVDRTIHYSVLGRISATN